jgi:excinuclease UvrABC nuclease subunit
MKESFLDNLAGIGEGTREKIKKQFTLKEIKKASPQEIATRLHLSANRADRIWQLIHVAQLGS